MISNSLVIAAFGAILFVVIELSSKIFNITSPLFNILSYASLVFCVITAIIYYVIKKVKKE